MRTNSIYIAIPVKDAFFENQELISLFVSGNPDYLTQFSFQNETFWGKKLEAPINLEDLTLAGENIISILSKVYPSHHLKIDDIRVFPDPNSVTLQSTEYQT